MEVLVLGGTRFLGRAFAEEALGRGHRLTLFNRGESNPGLFSQAERIAGDRDGGLEALRGRSFDAVLDTSGYVPRVVRASAELLAGRTGLYVFVSSISVYANEAVPGQDESAPVATIADPSVEEITGETYGALKALCEEEVVRLHGARAMIIRPGLIVGPHDASDRFTYWVDRVARGGEILAPDGPDYRTQFIDVRDLAAWMLDLLEREQTGDVGARSPAGTVFNATGPERHIRLGDLMDVCHRVSGSDATFVWADAAFLLEQGVQPWIELPLWIPGEEGVGGNAFDISRALAAGLRFRPLEETVADTLAWSRSRPEDHPFRAGLSAERESELLRAWHDRMG